MSRIPSFILLLLSLFLFAACSSAPNQASFQSAEPVSYVPSLENLQSSFRGLVETVLPGVVKIDVVEIGTRPSTGQETNPFFEFFFGQRKEEETPQEFRSEGLGSGVIVRRDGDTVYVLTNAHVIGEANEITVTLDDGRDYRAELVGKDERKDLALVAFKTRETDIVLVRLGDSDQLQVGDWVLAMGSPYGFQSTVTAGIISALHRTGGPGGNISDFIQTDAAINRGNSGGALVNLQGEVVGINTWITTQTGGSVGLGFAIPINNVKRAIDDFIKDGQVSYGWLGVSISSVDRPTQESLGLPHGRGALVNSVYISSPAGRAGILPGDFITAINGRRVETSDAVVLQVGELLVDEFADFSLIRDGKEEVVKVKIVTRESEDQIAGQAQDLWTGAVVIPLSDELRTQLSLDPGSRGVLVGQVTRRSSAAIAGLESGDLITAVNGQAVTNLRTYFRALNSRLSGDIEFQFIRQGVELKITIVRS